MRGVPPRHALDAPAATADYTHEPMVREGEASDTSLMFQRRSEILWSVAAVALLCSGVGLVLMGAAPGFAWALIVWGLGLAARSATRFSSQTGEVDRSRWRWRERVTRTHAQRRRHRGHPRAQARG